LATLDENPGGRGGGAWLGPLKAGLPIWAPVLAIAAAALVAVSVAQLGLGGVWQSQLVRHIAIASQIAILAAMLGAIPVAVAWRFKPTRLFEAVSIGMATRFLVMALALLVAFAGWALTHVHFVLAAIAFYMVGLIAETFVTIRMVNQVYGHQR